MDKYRIGYASYSTNVPKEQRELFGRMLAKRLQDELRGVLGAEVEIIYCPARKDVLRAIDTGCTVIITEGRLKRSEGAREGDENIGTGTIKDWTGLPGMERVILILAAEDHPAVITKDDGSKTINGRKVVELYRRGYYDALYLTDMTAANIGNLIKHGRKEAEAKEYYQVTDEMLEILLAGERAKNERNRKKAERSSFKEMFTVPQSEKTADESRREKEVPAEEYKEPVPEKTVETAKEDLEASDIFRSLLAGGVDAYLDNLDKWQADTDSTGDSIDPREDTGMQAEGEDMDGFDFGGQLPEDDCCRDDQEEEILQDGPQISAEPEDTREPEMYWEDAGEYAVLDTSFDLTQQGRISGYLQGGTLLVIDLPKPPQEQDANRYRVTVIHKGRQKGYVHNGRYQSSVVAFGGYCIKTIMQRSVLVEIPDEEAPGEYVAGKDCYVTFNPLA